MTVIKGKLVLKKNALGVSELVFEFTTQVYSDLGGDYLAERVYLDWLEADEDFGAGCVDYVFEHGEIDDLIYLGNVPDHWHVTELDHPADHLNTQTMADMYLSLDRPRQRRWEGV